MKKNPRLPELFTKAEAGDAASMREIGECYKTGNGVKKSREDALKWTRQAASLGDVEAMWNMAWLVRRENVVGYSNEPLDKNWIRKAADHGHTGAMVRLGWTHFRDRHDSQGPEKALARFREAVDLGDFNGCRGMHAYYLLPGHLNRVQAYAWGILVVERVRGPIVDRARMDLEALENLMTAVQIAEAKALAPTLVEEIEQAQARPSKK